MTSGSKDLFAAKFQFPQTPTLIPLEIIQRHPGPLCTTRNIHYS